MQTNGHADENKVDHGEKLVNREGLGIQHRHHLQRV